MTSREIADLVGSRHDNVKRTIETLVDRGVITRPQIEDESYVDGSGRTVVTKVFVFSGKARKRDSLVVVAQLSPECTARLAETGIIKLPPMVEKPTDGLPVTEDV